MSSFRHIRMGGYFVEAKDGFLRDRCSLPGASAIRPCRKIRIHVRFPEEEGANRTVEFCLLELIQSVGVRRVDIDGHAWAGPKEEQQREHEAWASSDGATAVVIGRTPDGPQCELAQHDHLELFARCPKLPP